ncbi:hypothetical protein D9758_006685 [Tetrapyrgos nigripes]|uniref:rRNA-processing protein EFG1 n=1 Tax=Tetrapyrgos nigripes TaxID=182062 RepID=A0A8H5GIW7_9AGAR|nr:hypothetical protein D9758_006685 [Tetrapyrgos nigripes]
MGPTRTEKHSSRNQASYPEAGPSKKRSKRTKETDVNAVPGVQKIKSTLRQTRRLLAKDNLAPDARITAERKLKSLEEDLAKAELSRKEKKIATRYHKIKFFERQKVVRKIKQLKKNISEADKSDRKKLESELFEQRVNLNFILHYPKTKKYISLFPPDVRHKDDTPHSEPISKTSSTDREREDIRNWIRERMTKGDLPLEAETEKESSRQKPSPKAQYPEKPTKQKKSKGEEIQPSRQEEEDDFFETQEEDSEEEDQGMEVAEAGDDDGEDEDEDE